MINQLRILRKNPACNIIQTAKYINYFICMYNWTFMFKNIVHIFGFMHVISFARFDYSANVFVT